VLETKLSDLTAIVADTNEAVKRMSSNHEELNTILRMMVDASDPRIVTQQNA
jgi:hypothetical protein